MQLKPFALRVVVVPGIFIIFAILFYILPVSAQDAKAPVIEKESVVQQEVKVNEAVKAQAATETAVVDNLSTAENVTLDFKDADIRNILKIISYKAGVNIVTTPEVMGTVTIRLVDVPWEHALDTILRLYGFGYEKKGKIITVAPIEKLTEQKKQEVELAQVQPTVTEIFNLKYIDAQDAKKALDPQLSPRGKITILEMSGQAGWEFSTAELTKRKRLGEGKVGRSKVLIISDIPPVLDKLRDVVMKIDVKPQQVFIETKIMEVNRDKLRDIGFDWGTGSSGTSAITQLDIGRDSIGAHGLGFNNATITPSIFGTKATGLTPTTGGLEIIYKKLTGDEFEAILYALDEDVNTNMISAPRIMALNNQEASILVGTKYPILKTEESTQTAGYTVSKSLDYYQDIGIQLNVVPQISGENYINMVVHPAVSTTTSGVGSQNTTYYPIIETREAETRILMKDGETVVIGGLLKDIKSKSTIGIPFLSKVPFIGPFFRRDTTDTGKIDLLIFITASIVKEETLSPETIAKLEDNLGKESKPVKQKN